MANSGEGFEVDQSDSHNNISNFSEGFPMCETSVTGYVETGIMQPSVSHYGGPLLPNRDVLQRTEEPSSNAHNMPSFLEEPHYMQDEFNNIMNTSCIDNPLIPLSTTSELFGEDAYSSFLEDSVRDNQTDRHYHAMENVTVGGAVQLDVDQNFDSEEVLETLWRSTMLTTEYQVPSNELVTSVATFDSTASSLPLHSCETNPGTSFGAIWNNPTDAFGNLNIEEAVKNLTRGDKKRILSHCLQRNVNNVLWDVHFSNIMDLEVEQVELIRKAVSYDAVILLDENEAAISRHLKQVLNKVRQDTPEERFPDKQLELCLQYMIDYDIYLSEAHPFESKQIGPKPKSNDVAIRFGRIRKKIHSGKLHSPLPFIIEKVEQAEGILSRPLFRRRMKPALDDEYEIDGWPVSISKLKELRKDILHLMKSKESCILSRSEIRKLDAVKTPSMFSVYRTYAYVLQDIVVGQESEISQTLRRLLLDALESPIPKNDLFGKNYPQLWHEYIDGIGDIIVKNTNNGSVNSVPHSSMRPIKAVKRKMGSANDVGNIHIKRVVIHDRPSLRGTGKVGHQLLDFHIVGFGLSGKNRALIAQKVVVKCFPFHPFWIDVIRDFTGSSLRFIYECLERVSAGDNYEPRIPMHAWSVVQGVSGKIQAHSAMLRMLGVPIPQRDLDGLRGELKKYTVEEGMRLFIENESIHEWMDKYGIGNREIESEIRKITRVVVKPRNSTTNQWSNKSSITRKVCSGATDEETRNKEIFGEPVSVSPKEAMDIAMYLFRKTFTNKLWDTAVSIHLSLKVVNVLKIRMRAREEGADPALDVRCMTIAQAMIATIRNAQFELTYPGKMYNITGQFMLDEKRQPTATEMVELLRKGKFEVSFSTFTSIMLMVSRLQAIMNL